MKGSPQHGPAQCTQYQQGWSVRAGTEGPRSALIMSGWWQVAGSPAALSNPQARYSAAPTPRRAARPAASRGARPARIVAVSALAPLFLQEQERIFEGRHGSLRLRSCNQRGSSTLPHRMQSQGPGQISRRSASGDRWSGGGIDRQADVEARAAAGSRRASGGTLAEAAPRRRRAQDLHAPRLSARPPPAAANTRRSTSGRFCCSHPRQASAQMANQLWQRYRLQSVLP